MIALGRRLCIAGLCALLCACAPAVVKLEEAFVCPIDAAKLAERCAEPQAEGENATYQDVIVAAQSDRASLRTCKAHDELLAKTVAACNEAILKHNEAIRALNQRYAAAK